jgi:hypothetical protein
MQLSLTTLIKFLVVVVGVVDCTQGREILCTGGDQGN